MHVSVLHWTILVYNLLRWDKFRHDRSPLLDRYRPFGNSFWLEPRTAAHIENREKTHVALLDLRPSLESSSVDPPSSKQESCSAKRRRLHGGSSVCRGMSTPTDSTSSCCDLAKIMSIHDAIKTAQNGRPLPYNGRTVHYRLFWTVRRRFVCRRLVFNFPTDFSWDYDATNIMR